MASQYLSWALRFVLLGAVGSLVVPLCLYAWRPAFPGALWLALAFSGIGLEKVWSSFLRHRQRTDLRVESDWTTVSVGLSYLLVMYAVLAECFWRAQGVVLPWVALLGGAVYVAALLLRYWALGHLGAQWAVQLDKPIGERHLVCSGPYAWVRHPLYVAYMLETVGVPLLFNTWSPLLLTLLTFVPLERHRARYEEGLLRRTFGDEYTRYAARTPAFLPLRRARRHERVDAECP
jgi:protein-S-isoprenylcysteine O-methyltransferase Ste14